MPNAVQRILGVLALILATPAAYPADPPNAQLSEIKAADQADRAPGQDNIDWSVVSVRDAERRTEVRKILAAGQIRTAADYLAAALIFQHSESADDIRIAHSLATIAYSLAPESHDARFLLAATWDRLMMRLKRPQWYGTQYVKQGDLWVLYDLDESAATDEERKRLGGRTLAESRALAERMNAEMAAAKP